MNKQELIREINQCIDDINRIDFFDRQYDTISNYDVYKANDYLEESESLTERVKNDYNKISNAISEDFNFLSDEEINKKYNILTKRVNML